MRLSRSTDRQLKESNKIARRNLREGDLVFFTSRSSRKKVAHVGIYLKDGKFIHAPSFFVFLVFFSVPAKELS